MKVQSTAVKVLAGSLALTVLVSCAASAQPLAQLVSQQVAQPAAQSLASQVAAVQPATKSKLSWPAGLPVYDHVVIVLEENKGYDQIIGSADAPYINDTLKKEGANLVKMFGEEHKSEGNYFWLFSGSNQDIGFKDKIPDQQITAPNLGEQLLEAGLSFKGYSEDLPAIGATGAKSDKFARKHAPWISFANVPNGKTAADSSNLRFADFPSDFSKLPTVAIVVPNLDHDMHDGSVGTGDTWLKEHIGSYYAWAKQNNSLLILTFDESEHGKTGLTDPAAAAPEDQNHIVAILAGAHIKPGDYAEGPGVTHVNLLRTLEAMYGLHPSGAQQQNAAAAGIADTKIITDVFATK